MKMDTVELLDAKIADLITESYRVDISSDEHQQIIEEIKTLSDISVKLDDIYLKENIHAEDVENSKKINWWQVGIDVTKIVAPTIIGGMFYAVFQRNLLHFEETGTLASKASKDLPLPNGVIRF